MLLYLVQHGNAKKEEDDPSRPLSEKGKDDVMRIALHLSRLDSVAPRILHSGKLRAEQTAEIIASRLAPPSCKGLSGTDGLSPLDDPGTWGDRLTYVTEDIMLVGHLPHLGRLASLLLCGDREKNAVSFIMGCVVCLGRDEKGIWSMRWMITPEIIR
jgi:phosphohistidine phosphatase